MKVRMFEGTYEDNGQVFVTPVAFPMEDMTNHANEDIHGPDHVDLHDEEEMKVWARAAFGEEWAFYEMEIPEGAIVKEEG